MSHTTKTEERAMTAVRRERFPGVSAQIFAIAWRRSKEGLKNRSAREYIENAGAREDAEYVLRPAVDAALDVQELMENEQGAGLPPRRPTRPRPDRDEDAGIKLAESTVLRSEATALLVAELAGEREDVQQYRGRYLKGGTLTARQMDRYLDTLAYIDTLAENEDDGDDELERLVDAVCDAFGIEVWDALDIILAGYIRSPLRPVRIGSPEPDPSVRRLHISFAPWCSGEDAAAALRRAQLHAAAGVDMSDYVLEPWRIPEDVSGQRVAGPGDDAVILFIFVSRRRASGERQTWETLRRDFETLQDEESSRYKNERSFSQAYRRTRAALTEWLPVPRARPRLEE